MRISNISLTLLGLMILGTNLLGEEGVNPKPRKGRDDIVIDNSVSPEEKVSTNAVDSDGNKASLIKENSILCDEIKDREITIEDVNRGGLNRKKVVGGYLYFRGTELGKPYIEERNKLIADAVYHLTKVKLNDFKLVNGIDPTRINGYVVGHGYFILSPRDDSKIIHKKFGDRPGSVKVYTLPLNKTKNVIVVAANSPDTEDRLVDVEFTTKFPLSCIISVKSSKPNDDEE